MDSLRVSTARGIGMRSFRFLYAPRLDRPRSARAIYRLPLSGFAWLFLLHWIFLRTRCPAAATKKKVLLRYSFLTCARYTAIYSLSRHYQHLHLRPHGFFVNAAHHLTFIAHPVGLDCAHAWSFCNATSLRSSCGSPPRYGYLRSWTSCPTYRVATCHQTARSADAVP